MENTITTMTHSFDVDKTADSILRVAGTSLKNYSPKAQYEIRITCQKAMRSAYEAGYQDGKDSAFRPAE